MIVLSISCCHSETGAKRTTCGSYSHTFAHIASKSPWFHKSVFIQFFIQTFFQKDHQFITSQYRHSKILCYKIHWPTDDCLSDDHAAKRNPMKNVAQVCQYTQKVTLVYLVYIFYGLWARLGCTFCLGIKISI